MSGRFYSMLACCWNLPPPLFFHFLASSSSQRWCAAYTRKAIPTSRDARFTSQLASRIFQSWIMPAYARLCPLVPVRTLYLQHGCGQPVSECASCACLRRVCLPSRTWCLDLAFASQSAPMAPRTPSRKEGVEIARISAQVCRLQYALHMVRCYSPNFVLAAFCLSGCRHHPAHDQERSPHIAAVCR